MPQRIVAELVKRRTRAGDSFYVGHVPNPDGGWTRLVLFFDEMRTSADGAPVEVWQLRAEEVLARPSQFERAPPASRRVGAAKNGQRPVNGP